MSDTSDRRDEGFQVLRRLRRAAELVGARRFPEAELELMRVLALRPRDLRALKLLALVRFKLGRLAEARDVFRTALEAAPDDEGVQLNLGLVALKLEWFEDAVAQLEPLVRAQPDDARAWGYLGYAYARLGTLDRAAAAFRRAGQPDLAAETERRHAGARPNPLRPKVPVTAVPAAWSARPPTVEAPAAEGGPIPLTAFVLGRLLGETRAAEVVPLGVLEFPVGHEAHVRQPLLLATSGDLRLGPARHRQHGRPTEDALGRFLLAQGAGELWLSTPVPALVPLILDQDILYLRQERVAAFDGDVAWECGRIPRDTGALLQFRGSGRVVLEASADEVVALRIEPGQMLTVPAPRLVGWVGRVVAQCVRSDDAPGGTPRIACEGEGVLLLCQHGDSTQSVHERPQPGHHGAGAPGPGGAVLHR